MALATTPGSSDTEAQPALPADHPLMRRLAWGAGMLVACYVLLSLVLVIAGSVLVHWSALNGLRAWDERVNGWIADRRTPLGNRLSLDGTFLANTMSVVVAGVAVSAVAALRRCYRVVIALWSALAVELSTFLTVNYLVARPRPSVAHLGSTPSTFSFPSGHVAATLVTWVTVAVLVRSQVANRVVRSLIWALPLSMVVWVGTSRVYAGQHHVIDVLVGLTLGASALAAGWLAPTWAEAAVHLGGRPSWPTIREAVRPRSTARERGYRSVIESSPARTGTATVLPGGGSGQAQTGS